MAQKSKGMRRNTRQKLTKDRKSSDSTEKHLRDFDDGDRVRIHFDPSVHQGFPHPRFHGRSGTVTEKRGRSYIVAVKDGGKTKEFPIYPAHLKHL